MENNRVIKIIILFLVCQIGVMFSFPQVLCFGEDGHVQIEAVKIKLHHQATGQFSPDKKKPATASFTGSETDGCGECHDLPLDFRFYIKKEIISSDLLSPETCLEFKSKFSDPGATEKRVFDHTGNPDNICSTVNHILKKMSFLI